MAFLMDEDRQDGLASPAPALGGGGAVPSSAAPPAPASGSYTDLRAYLTGNQPAIQQMGAGLAAGIDREAQASLRPDMQAPTLADDGEGHRREALGRLDAAQSQSGRAALLQQQAGPGYTPGQSRLDAYLLGAGGMGPLNDVRAKWGGLLPALTTAGAARPIDAGPSLHGVENAPPAPNPGGRDHAGNPPPPAQGMTPARTIYVKDPGGNGGQTVPVGPDGTYTDPYTGQTKTAPAPATNRGGR